MHTLPYWIDFEDRPGYLRACIHGLTDTLETSMSFWQATLTEAYERRAERLLVQEDFRNNLSFDEMADICRFIGDLLTRLSLRHLRIAFIDERPEQHEMNQFGEIVALGQGLHLRVFTQPDAAEAWLQAAEGRAETASSESESEESAA